MYHVLMDIWTRGVGGDILDIWRAMAPLARFTHAFHVVMDIGEIVASEYGVVIAVTDDPVEIAALRAAVGTQGTVIVCAAHPQAFPAEALDRIDELWEAELTPELARFHFARLQQRQKARKDAWLTSNYLERTINTLPDMVWFKDIEGLHLKVNDAFCQSVNKTKEDVEGRDHYYIWGISREEYENSDYICVDTEADVIKARKTCLYDEEVMAADGLRKLKTYKTPIFDGDEIIGTVGIARDVTKMYEYEKTIVNMANTDQLTGLANRHRLNEFYRDLHAGWLALVMLDLDYFKRTNDEYGHQSGDAALMVAGALLKQAFPDALTVRLGGDEFMIVISTGNEQPDESLIRQRVEDFQAELLRYYQMSEETRHVSASAGIATGDLAMTSFEIIMQHCDDTLYAAKKARRGSCQVYDGSQIMSKEK